MTTPADINPLALPQRVAFVGDWHGNTAFAVESIALARSQGADVLLHVGDFGDQYAPEFFAAVDAALGEVPLLYVDGNHERYDLLGAAPLDAHGLQRMSARTWHLPRGFRWEWHGRTWLACGGATSVNREELVDGVSWWPQETLTPEQVETIAAAGPADILISHDSPAGADTPRNWKGRFPDAELAKADAHRDLFRALFDAVRPHRHVHGHYHQRYDTVFQGARISGLGSDGQALPDNVLIADPKEIL